MLSIDFAPMEGITGFAFRNAHHRYYSGIARYFTPFLNAQEGARFGRSDERDISRENNISLLEDQGCALVPQLLAGRSGPLVAGIRRLCELGYREVNWNLGCPSPTVTRKGRGAGLLSDPEKIDRILFETFDVLEKENVKFHLSVKMRTGMDSAEHLPEMVSVLNRYPLSEIILHPRTAAQGYQGPVDEEAFAWALSASAHPIIWNGDILTVEDAEAIHSRFPQMERIMIARGLLKDPALAEEIRDRLSDTGNGKTLTESPIVADISDGMRNGSRESFSTEAAHFYAFHDEILCGYQSYIPDEKGILARMKELWGWWEKARFFAETEDASRFFKKIKKAKSLGEYRIAVEQVLQN